MSLLPKLSPANVTEIAVASVHRERPPCEIPRCIGTGPPRGRCWGGGVSCAARKWQSWDRNSDLATDPTLLPAALRCWPLQGSGPAGPSLCGSASAPEKPEQSRVQRKGFLVLTHCEVFALMFFFKKWEQLFLLSLLIMPT